MKRMMNLSRLYVEFAGLRPDDMFVNEGCIRDLGGFFEVASNSCGDEVLDLFCRDAADSAGLFGPALQQRR
jgi:hypothetical protein